MAEGICELCEGKVEPGTGQLVSVMGGFGEAHRSCLEKMKRSNITKGYRLDIDAAREALQKEDEAAAEPTCICSPYIVESALKHFGNVDCPVPEHGSGGAAAEPRDIWPDGLERIRIECPNCDAVHDLKRDIEGRWRIRLTSSGAAAEPVQDDASWALDAEQAQRIEATAARLRTDGRTCRTCGEPCTHPMCASCWSKAGARLRPGGSNE